MTRQYSDQPESPRHSRAGGRPAQSLTVSGMLGILLAICVLPVILIDRIIGGPWDDDDFGRMG